MKAYVIALDGHDYSQRCAERCISTAAEVGKIQVEPFSAINASESVAFMESEELRWTWGKGYDGIAHHEYGGALEPRIGCAMSHYALWKRCIETNEPLLILEHDAVFVSAFPDFEFEGICQINDPRGATPRGAWWSQTLAMKGPGVHRKTRVHRFDKPNAPDGLAGNSAYVVKPYAAKRLVWLYQTIGVWPNDATMCLQFFPYLEELYPFVTRVNATQSTTYG